ncbi:flagellar basal-body rod protein FlgG [Janthinobacterium sp. GW460P]|uniref:flagellar basal-body rod protein FlgG n=1 Tax=unclassified Janthinobacterium TaxID=2610881 RepID=UPI000A322635|nr:MULTISPECIES: flagellar basal-body rod protein FlgG [unclassified Janthinobacterium]MCC7705586.1 flagellar basal-body rod protein FlgG [Janthinobacterium sp. GW460P]MCC7711088.1 flagellar basal-body rod protein FlgG [Janthinobacterium sp. GW460W]
MNDSLYIAATGMHMQQKSVDTIANNLANVNTPGFKKGRVSFEDMVSREVSRAVRGDDVQAGQNLWRGRGVGIFSLSQVFTAGDLKKTDSAMDVAIKGEGFFEVVDVDGTPAYSRGGTLSVDKDGFLATSDGHVFKPAIHVGTDAREVSLSADGRVMVSRDKGEASEVGRIELARFSDTTGLLSLGGNLYKPSERSGDAIYGKPGDDGLGTLAQGFLESSNVKLIEEMVDLMVAQRAYESSVKVIQASDEMLGMSNNLRK